MATLVLSQIPNPHIAPSITTDQLALIRMDNNIIHRHAMRIIPLHIATPSVPDLDRAVLAARNEPFGLAVERNAGDIARVSVESEDRIRIGALDIVELDGMVPGGCEVALVRGDAEAVYLAVRVRDCARADAGQGFPEAGGVSCEARGGADWRTGLCGRSRLQSLAGRRGGCGGGDAPVQRITDIVGEEVGW